MVTAVKDIRPVAIRQQPAMLIDRSWTWQGRWIAMGGMMGTTGTWILPWILLALALGVTGGILIARGLHARHSGAPPQLPPAESPAVREAKDALRLRYVNGEISREDYLQGKVELED